MKVLQISSVYPVKDSPLENSYVRTFIKYFLKKRNAEFLVIKPVTYLPDLLIKFLQRKEYWNQKKRVIKESEYVDNEMGIMILPFISIGSVSSLHAFFSMFVYFFNRRRVRNINVSEFDIIHAHYLFPDGYLAYKLSKKFNIPYVITIRQEMRFIGSFLSRYLSKIIITNSKAVTTQSPQMHELLITSGIKKEIKLLPTGIEDYFFLSDSKRKNNSSKLKLISVCNLVPIKNLESVIYAIEMLKDKDLFSYTIYGTGPEESRLKNLVGDLNLGNIVIFKGVVDNEMLPGIYPEYDVFIQPSFKETFGLSYFEAMACGLPVILSENTGAWPLIKDKNVAFVVDPNDISSISGCIQNLINKRELVSEKSLNCKETSKIASWDNYVGYFMQKYEEEINQRLTTKVTKDLTKEPQSVL